MGRDAARVERDVAQKDVLAHVGEMEGALGQALGEREDTSFSGQLFFIQCDTIFKIEHHHIGRALAGL